MNIRTKQDKLLALHARLGILARQILEVLHYARMGNMLHSGQVCALRAKKVINALILLVHLQPVC